MKVGTQNRSRKPKSVSKPWILIPFRLISSSASAVFLLLIRIYWLTLSPIIGGVCRFQPTCSRYTAACIKVHGPWKGAWLGAKRIARCHPFCDGGFDPPPPAPKEHTNVVNKGSKAHETEI